MPVVLCARMLGWAREPAATSMVTGLPLIPFGRVLQLRCSRAHCCCPHYAIVEVIMAPRKPKAAPATPALPPQLAAVHLHAAGIDIGAEAHFVAVPPSDDPQPVRSFGAFTADLDALADWLAVCGITTVALASTGVY
jgi:hypothetical protein